MIALARTGELERFRTLVLGMLGLRFEDARLGFLGEVLQRRLDALKLDAATYLALLEAAAPAAEVAALAQELTVTETYFFRNSEQFRVLAEVVLPERVRRGAAGRLRFLSAGCASGEEAYSIAIVAHEALCGQPAGAAGWDVQVRAVDVNEAALGRARRARYSAWALRETPAAVRDRWFHADGRDLVLRDGARRPVTFEAANLMAEDPGLWAPGSYDAVYCRNVIMYFAPDRARALIGRITRALAPGGYLFLGHAETLRGLSEDFHLCHTHGTFYYRLRGAADGPQAALPEVAVQQDPGPPSRAAPWPAMPEPAAGDWVDVIRAASARVAALVPPPFIPPEAQPHIAPEAQPHIAPEAQPYIAPGAQRRGWDPARALDLVGRERFGEALAYVRSLPPDGMSDPDTLLFEAMLLAHAGDLGAAAETCRRLLAIDELNAGAHYVLALCRESAGDRAGAAEHDRIAVYLDPAFAMPRLHLGLLARRAGDRDGARRELGQALVLLKREDVSRLMLFGGGFNREALVQLCAAALAECGGAS